MSIVLFANFPTDVWGEYTPVGLSVSPDFHYASGCPTDQFRTEVVPSNTAGPAAYKFVLDMSCLGATPDYSKIVFQFSYQIWAARWGAPPSPGQYDHQVGWSPSTAYFSLPDYTEAHLSGSPFYDPENPDKYKITDAGLVNSDGVVIQAPKGDTPAVNDFCIKIDNVLRCGALDAASNNTREQICVNRDGATLCGPPACVVESMTTLNSKFCEAQGTYGYCDVPDMFGFAPLIPGYVPQSSKNLNPWAECWTSLYVPKVDPTIRAKKELDNAMTKAPFAWFAATGAMLQSLERFAYLDHDPSLKIAYTNFDYRGLAPGNGAGGVVMGEVPMLNEDSVGSRLMVMVRPILTGALLIGIFYGMYARWARAAFANIYTGKD